MSEHRLAIGPDAPVEIAGRMSANLTVVTITTTLDDGHTVTIQLHPHHAKLIAKQLDHLAERLAIRITEAEEQEREVLAFLERDLGSPGSG